MRCCLDATNIRRVALHQWRRLICSQERQALLLAQV
jgi:hypothetical protein